MPYFDGTGPLGQGPITGRGLGPCGVGIGWGRGRGLGRAFGRSFGRGFARPCYDLNYDPLVTDRYAYSQPSRKEEAEMLKDDAEALKEELTAIESRIKEIKETR